jgi:hypothetical protein
MVFLYTSSYWGVIGLAGFVWIKTTKNVFGCSFCVGGEKK